MQEAFRQLEADYIKAWGSTDHSLVEARENLWRATQILGGVRRHLLKVAQNGKLAEGSSRRQGFQSANIASMPGPQRSAMMLSIPKLPAPYARRECCCGSEGDIANRHHSGLALSKDRIGVAISLPWPLF